MPNEFWREVVDRVAAEAPDTLLLAEAFWLLEGYFVRTLGMHRVYNSAFMHMLRDEDNAGYRKVIRDTLEFDPAILGRYVNFLTNPDEETGDRAVRDRRQVLRRGDAARDAAGPADDRPRPDRGLHREVRDGVPAGAPRRAAERGRSRPTSTRQIVPLLRERRRFAGSADFRLYDVVGDGGGVVEDVFAYSNGRGGDRSLDRLPQPVRRRRPAGSATPSRSRRSTRTGRRRMRRDTLADALDARRAGRRLAPVPRPTDRAARRCGRSASSASRGLFVQLDAYGCLVIDELREVVSTADEPWAALAAELGGGWVPSLDDALADLRLRPVHDRASRRSSTAPTRRRRRARIDAAPRRRSTGEAFDDLRLATPLRRAGFDDAAIRAHAPRDRPAAIRPSSATPRRSPAAWLDDPDVARLPRGPRLGGADVPEPRPMARSRGAWPAALDRAGGARRASPALGRLRTAAERAGDDVDRLPDALAAGDGGRRSHGEPRRRSDRLGRGRGGSV